jgi:hypothetical protein
MNLRILGSNHLRLLLMAFTLSALSIGGFLAAASLTYRLGFPLDDAWIHQTYARSLGRSGEWAFLPGQSSAGSTAPLWSGLLAVGHALGFGPLPWAYSLGWALLVGLGAAGALALRELAPDKARWVPFGFGLLLVEWHMVWAAASGMETILFAVLVLLVLGLLVRINYQTDGGTACMWGALGLLIGLSVWVRPDGLTLAGPALFTLALSRMGKEYEWRTLLNMRAAAFALFFLGLLAAFLPYLVFNQATAGTWWPNTFFAKQAEYAVHRTLPISYRYLAQLGQPLVGAGILLAPGFVYFVWRLVRQKNWGSLAGALWFLGYLFMYAWRLPVTYQHGRYIMPAMPVFFIWGLVGLAYLTRFRSPQPARRILSSAWAFSTAAAALVFWWLGAQGYARDVQVIESEMVAAATWIRENTPEDAIVAAHDIGALGYFGERQLVDLAGLISPEVIPFIRDEDLLAIYLDESQVDYLVTFPGWYPVLVARAAPVFSTDAPFAPDLGGENMVVYRWR